MSDKETAMKEIFDRGASSEAATGDAGKPLTIEGLLRVLRAPGVMTIAGIGGSCERVVRYDELITALERARHGADNASLTRK